MMSHLPSSRDTSMFIICFLVYIGPVMSEFQQNWTSNPEAQVINKTYTPTPTTKTNMTFLSLLKLSKKGDNQEKTTPKLIPETKFESVNSVGESAHVNSTTTDRSKSTLGSGNSGTTQEGKVYFFTTKLPSPAISVNEKRIVNEFNPANSTYSDSSKSTPIPSTTETIEKAEIDTTKPLPVTQTAVIEKLIVMSKPILPVHQILHIESENRFEFVTPKWMGHHIINCHSGLSCSEKCGKGLPKLHDDPFKDLKCHCDKMCRVFGDCCQDYFFLCENLRSDQDVENFIGSRQLHFASKESVVENDDYVDMLLSKYGTCKSKSFFSKGYLRPRSMWFINTCPDNFQAVTEYDLKHSCEVQPRMHMFSFPVSHRWNPRLIYKNIYCALCHGVELRDIQFWSVEIHCDLLGNQTTWTIDELVDSVDNDDICKFGMAPTLPTNKIIFRSCLDANEIRCLDKDSKANNEIPTSRKELDFQLCNSYVRPIHHNKTTFANIHCLGCHNYSRAVEEDIALIFCPWVGPNFQAFPMTSYMAEVSFKNGKFSVNRKDKKDGGIGESIESVLPKNCTFASVNPKLSFLELCQDPSTCADTKPPEQRLQESELPCAIHKYMYTGNYNSIQSAPPGYFIEISLTFPHERQPDQLSILSYVIEESFSEILSKYSVYNPPGEYVLLDIIFPRASRANTLQVTIHWTSNETSITAQRLVALVDKRLRHKFENAYAQEVPSQQKVNSFVLSNFDTNDLLCSSGETVEWKYVNTIAYGYHRLIIIPNRPCILDLGKLSFKTSYKGAGHPPTVIDRVYVCLDPEFESKCGSVAPSDQTKQLQSPNGRNDLPKQVTNSDNILDNLRTFQNLCFSVCILGQIARIASIIHVLFKSNSEITTSVIFFTITRIVSSVILTILVILCLLSHKTIGLDQFLMGVISHFCWLALAGVTLLNALKCNTAIKLSTLRRITEMNILATLIVIGTCAIIEKDDAIRAQIGYSHTIKHIFWISNQVACSLVLIVFCAVYFTAAFGITIFILIRRRRGSSNGDEFADKRICDKSIATSNLQADVFPAILFLIGLVDYYQDSNYHLWNLIFGMVACCLGLWEIVFVCAPWHFSVTKTNPLSPEGQLNNRKAASDY